MSPLSGLLKAAVAGADRPLQTPSLGYSSFAVSSMEFLQ